ncbi:hypothetical protein NBRC116600_09110 [Thalassotalea sp. SU-HH00458]
MFKCILIMFSILLCSCTSLTFMNEAGVITVEKEKPFCDIKKVDPNCKLEKEVK